MEIVLLGTGAADGWPNPFCRCASCSDSLARGDVRAQTSALVDGTLLIDCGPEAPRSALRHGRTLAGVRHLLFTHAHPDHLGPQALLSRSWAMADALREGVSDVIGPADALDVIGPADVLDQCREWVGPDDPVRFVPVAAGDEITVGGYRVRVLPAEHRVMRDGDAVLYDVTGPDGDRLLWACDTGVLPSEWFARVDGVRFDVVLLEETFGDRTDLGDSHLGIAGFADTVTALRECGAVTSRTQVVAVHLGHHNPPVAQLRRRLAACGARVGEDGEVIVTGTAAAAATERDGRRSLVLGGARSGKSTFAEDLMATFPAVTYVATGGRRDGDEEWAQRVALHRARRPASWSTVETDDVAPVLRSADRPVLVDCLGTWLTARLDRHAVWTGGEVAAVEADIDELLAAWRDCRVPVVAVTNEVGSGVVPASASGRLFRDLLGRLNARVAAESESVTLVVAGIPVDLR